MNTGSRKLVQRACAVCEWQGTAVEESIDYAMGCPWCHAPTRVLTEQWVAPHPTPVDARAAVAFGRQGGLIGGRLRAERLSAKRRTEIAREAALARWRNRKPR